MTRLTVQPLHGVAEGDGEGHWRSLTADPSFELLTDTGARVPSWAAGWYRLDIQADASSLKKMSAAKIYPDEGAGYYEQHSKRVFWFNRTSYGASAWFKLEHAASRLRLDPMEFACDFSLLGVSVTPVSRYEVILRMVREIVRRRGLSCLPQLGSDVVRAAWNGGLSASAAHIHSAFNGVIDMQMSDYALWLCLYDDWKALAAPSADKITFSVLLPVYNTPIPLLRECINSVLAQTHRDWELCVVDDASSDPDVSACIRDFMASDSRIRLKRRSSNGHIARASNDALEMAQKDYCVLMDHDDILHTDALMMLANAIVDNPDAGLVFSDEDKIDLSGQRRDPYFKSGFNLTLLHGHNCICHVGCYKTTLVRALGGFDPDLSGAQDWDLALRAVRRLKEEQVVHVPRVLYHWRVMPGSTALAPGEKNYAHEAAKAALEKDLKAYAPAGTRVSGLDGYRGCFRIHYPVPVPSPKVIVAIPTRDQADHLAKSAEGVLNQTDYDDLELVIIDNGSVERRTRLLLERLVRDRRVRVIRHDALFNYSELNNIAFAKADGDAFLLLNNDVEIIHADWLKEMVSRLFQDGVGVVGCMLYYPDDTIQHAGVVTGFGHTAAHVYPAAKRGSTGVNHRAGLAQEVSAVTGACLLTRAGIYRQLGGLDEQFEVAFNDIDYCLRVRASGYKVVWTPFAELYHHESKSRGYDVSGEKLLRFEQEAERLRKRWLPSLNNDPYYNPNFALHGLPYDLAFPPRIPAFGCSSV